jgi:hypothetical protein
MMVVMMPLRPSSSRSNPCCRTRTAAAGSTSPIAAAAVGCDAAVCEVLWRAVAEGEAGDGGAAGADGEGGLMAAVQQVPHLRSQEGKQMRDDEVLAHPLSQTKQPIMRQIFMAIKTTRTA